MKPRLPHFDSLRRLVNPWPPSDALDPEFDDWFLPIDPISLVCGHGCVGGETLGEYSEGRRFTGSPTIERRDVHEAYLRAEAKRRCTTFEALKAREDELRETQGAISKERADNNGNYRASMQNVYEQRRQQRQRDANRLPSAMSKYMLVRLPPPTRENMIAQCGPHEEVWDCTNQFGPQFFTCDIGKCPYPNPEKSWKLIAKGGKPT